MLLARLLLFAYVNASFAYITKTSVIHSLPNSNGLEVCEVSSKHDNNTKSELTKFAFSLSLSASFACFLPIPLVELQGTTGWLAKLLLLLLLLLFTAVAESPKADAYGFSSRHYYGGISLNYLPLYLVIPLV